MEKHSTQNAASAYIHSPGDMALRLALCLVLTAVLVNFPTIAYAATGSDPLSQTICRVVGWFTGGLGRAVATLGVLVLAIGAMLGKVSWQMALTVAIGISIMFSGATIVTLLTGETASCKVSYFGDSGMIEEVLCRLGALAGGPTGRAFGTLAIIFLGVGALMGKVSPGMAILLAAGLGTFFGADQIVTALSGVTGGAPCSPTAASGGGGGGGGGMGLFS